MLQYVFLKIPGLFFFIFVFSIKQLVDNLVDKISLMMGFEPQIFGVGSDSSTNRATTTTRVAILWCLTYHGFCGIFEQLVCTMHSKKAI